MSKAEIKAAEEERKTACTCDLNNIVYYKKVILLRKISKLIDFDFIFFQKNK